MIIHSAAERRPDVSEGDPEATEALNVAATRQLAELSKEVGAWMLYLSTDYVFDGTEPPYHPGDKPNPLNNYGQSKFDGEQVMREIVEDGAILRVPILYGPIEELAESAVTLIFESVRKGTATLDNWATRYPTQTQDVADAIRKMVNRHYTDGNVLGTFHFSGDEPLTKYEMALIMAEIAGLDGSGLTPSDSAPPGAPRPKNCQLDCSRLEYLIDPKRTPFKEAIADALKPYLP